MTQEDPSDVRELISEARIQERVSELARQIEADYHGVDEVVLVGILKGSFIFLADLARRLSLPRRIEFMAVSSYRDGDRAGAVRLLMDLRTDIRHRHVIIVEDIVDSGRTLEYLLNNLKARGPASVESCVLVRKPDGEHTPTVRYLGFEIPDAWVVGYGLDFAERHRTLPYIGVLEQPPEDAAPDEPAR